MIVDPVTTMAVVNAGLSAIETGKKIVNEIESYKKFFQLYKPTIKNLQLNYEDGSAEISMHLFIPTNKRIGGKVEINIPKNYQILEFYDSSFNKIDLDWQKNDSGFVIKTKKLPRDSEDFLCRSRGYIDKKGIEQFVDLRVSSSPFEQGGEDKYWIVSSIKAADVLREIYTDLRIDRVNLDVRVGVKRCFSTTIPHELRTVLDARNRLIKATESGNRNMISKMQYRLRNLPKVTRVAEGDIIELLTELISKNTFRKYVYTKEPYNLSDIFQDEDSLSLIPECMNVRVFTDLNYTNKMAKGELAFRKEKYKEEIKDEMGKLMKKKKNDTYTSRNPKKK